MRSEPLLFLVDYFWKRLEKKVEQSGSRKKMTGVEARDRVRKKWDQQKLTKRRERGGRRR